MAAVSFELPDPARHEDGPLGFEWPDGDRRDAALERVLLRTVAGRASQNRSSGRPLPQRLPQRLVPTAGQLRVIEAMSHGLTAEQAGELLGLSTHTVKAHLKQSARAMAAKNTVQLVALCLRRELIR